MGGEQPEARTSYRSDRKPRRLRGPYGLSWRLPLWIKYLQRIIEVSGLIPANRASSCSRSYASAFRFRFSDRGNRGGMAVFQTCRPPAGARGGSPPRRFVAGLDHGQRVVERRKLGHNGGRGGPDLLALVSKLIALFRERAGNSDEHASISHARFLCRPDPICWVCSH